MAVVKRRMPAVAGHFYPADRSELLRSIEESFLHRLGPGRLPEPSGSRSRESLGFVSPHAGYMYSGPIAAHVYYRLAAEGKPDIVVLVGPNHHGMGSLVAAYKEGVWVTPLGEVEVDSDFVREMVARSRYLDLDDKAHAYEHSLEVQVPFLQYIYGSKVRIAPITIMHQTLEVARDLAGAIKSAAEALGLDYVIIASSDFTHYEPHDVASKKDSIAIELILKLDPEGLYAAVDKYNITMCGPGAVATLLYTARLAGSRGGELLKYATSGDVTGEKGWVVGYAALRIAAPEG